MIYFWMYFLSIVLTFAWAVGYISVRAYRFAMKYSVTMDAYLDGMGAYLDTCPDAPVYLIAIRIIILPIWYPMNLAKCLNDCEEFILRRVNEETNQ